MLDSEEIRWVKSTANELNNLLQVISEASQVLENLCEPTYETDKYFGMLQNAIERATKVTRLMVDRVGGYSAESAITLPEPATVQEAAGVLPADIKINNPQGPLELVMIVDDEDFVTMLAQRVMAEQGYRVITAKDGFQALDIFKRLHREISLIILDFTMPVMDGADVFHELLQVDANVPVVLSSGFAEQDRLRGMLARGLRGFIPKPYTQQKLLTQIRTTLDAIKTERATGRRP
jgi:CheY-like chemotaxis protein